MSKSNLEIRKIKSLKFLYEISEDGKVVRNVKSKRRIKMVEDRDGYLSCYFNIGGKIIHKSVASLVAECWHGDRPEGMQIDHIDRNRKNNDRRNLRYVTWSEQMKNRVLSERIINQATQNCYRWTMEHVAKPVTATNGEIVIACASMSKCANVMGSYLKINPEHIRSKMKKRRKNINGFDIYYGLQRLDTATLKGKE